MKWPFLSSFVFVTAGCCRQGARADTVGRILQAGYPESMLSPGAHCFSLLVCDSRVLWAGCQDLSGAQPVSTEYFVTGARRSYYWQCAVGT